MLDATGGAVGRSLSIYVNAIFGVLSMRYHKIRFEYVFLSLARFFSLLDSNRILENISLKQSE